MEQTSSLSLELGQPRVSWFAIRVKPQFDQVVCTSLQAKGFEQFLATYQVPTRKRAVNEKRTRVLPLFPGYVFARFAATSRLPILVIPGVIGIVGFNRVPAPIPEDQMNNMRQLVRASNTVGPWPFLASGDRVRIERGPLAGVEGLLLKVRSSFRLVVSIDLLQRSLSAEVDRSWVYPLGQLRPSDAKYMPAACGAIA